MPVDREAAFVALFDANYGRVLAYATRRIGPDVARDVVADTFVTAWLRLEELRGDPLIWLYGLARGSVANHRRRLLRAQRLGERSGQLSLPRAENDPADQVASRDSFAAAFGQLAESDREVLRLVAWEGLDADAAAAVLGCSTGAFKVRLHRARRRLRRYLRLDDGLTRVIGTAGPAFAFRANAGTRERRGCTPVAPKEFPCR
jgi:RNA polymerase sigma factor (sigma-70 family)